MKSVFPVAAGIVQDVCKIQGKFRRAIVRSRVQKIRKDFLPDSQEATTGFGPVIRVLQTHALPLGYVAIHSSVYSAPCVGLEPTTPRLTAACSTD